MSAMTVRFLIRENNELLSKQKKLADNLKEYFQLDDQRKKLEQERDQWKSRALNPKSILKIDKESPELLEKVQKSVLQFPLSNKPKTNTSNSETVQCTPSTSQPQPEMSTFRKDIVNTLSTLSGKTLDLATMLSLDTGIIDGCLAIPLLQDFLDLM